MFYRLFKNKSGHPNWGGATYLYETDKNGNPTRKLVVYENGKIFGYDTENQSDEAGSLEDKPLYQDKKGRRQWAKYKIRRREFEKAWRQPESVPVDPHQDTLHRIHKAGKWIIALGILNTVVGLVSDYAIYNKHGVSMTAKHWALVYYFVSCVLIGLSLLSIGTLLQRTTSQKLVKVPKLIIIAILLIFTVPVLLGLLVAGSGSIGILGLIVLYQILEAQKKTVQLGYTTTIQYRLAVLGAALLLVLAGALASSHFKHQLVSKAASSSTTATRLRQPKRFTSTQAASTLADATSIAQAQQALQTFASQYNLKLQVANAASTSSTFSYDPIGSNDLGKVKTYGAVWIDEWAKYPVDWVQQSKLQTVVFVKNLSSGELSPGVSDPSTQTLYYDITASGITAQSTVHQNFFSLISATIGVPSDQLWSSYNKADFVYASTDSYCQDTENTPVCYGREHPGSGGFVNDYATSSVQADRMETYTYLMTTSYFHDLNVWLPNDPILQNKVRYLISYISHYSPEMQGNYYSEVNP